MNYYDLTDEEFEALITYQVEDIDYSRDVFQETEEMLNTTLTQDI